MDKSVFSSASPTKLSRAESGFFMKIKRICKLCNKTFYVYPSRPKRGQGVYCSRKCLGNDFSVLRKNIPRSEEIRNKIRKGCKGINIGSKNGRWKGDKAGYQSLHNWVWRHKGKPVKCEICGITRNLQWANKSGEYKRDLSDWFTLCQKCHTNFDKKNPSQIKNKCKYINNFYPNK